MLSPKKKYTIETNENSRIKLDKNYSTNDLDLKSLIEIINESDEGWELISKDKCCTVQRKFELNCEIPYARTTAYINGYSAKEIFDGISIISDRLEWDKNFKEFILVEQNLNEGWEIFYMTLKVRSIKIVSICYGFGKRSSTEKKNLSPNAK